MKSSHLFHKDLPRHARTSGFGLVEVMVALLIGMVGMLVMLQVFSWSEAQRRTTTGGSDAISNGAIALHGLQREIGLAGHGLTSTNLLLCNLLLRPGVTLNRLAPVTINHASIPAGDANTDTLLVVYSNTAGSPEGDGITAQPSGNSYAVQTPGSFGVGHLVIATPQTRASPCALTLNTVATVASPNVTVASAIAGMSNGTLFNVGTALTVQAFAVRSGNLTVCNLMANDCFAAGNVGNAAIWVPIANNIVSLRAQYGRDTSATMHGTVDSYDQDNSTITSACTLARVSAIRLALVARSALYEKDTVTAAAPAWSGSGTLPIDLSGNAEWQKYRYRAFETVVSMRNVSWLGVPSGC